MSIKYTPEELDIIEQMAADGYTIRHIAKCVGRSVTGVRDVIRRYKFKYTKNRTEFSPVYIEKIRIGIEAGKTLAAISAELDIPPSTIGRWARSYNLVTVHPKSVVTEETIEKLRELVNAGYNKKDISEALGITGSTVSKWCNKFDVCEPTYFRKSPYDGDKNFELRLQRIQSMLDKDYSYLQIGKELGLSGSTISTYVRKYDLVSNRKYRRTTEEFKNKVMELSDEGYKPSEIAVMLHMEQTEVYYIKRIMKLNS